MEKHIMTDSERGYGSGGTGSSDEIPPRGPADEIAPAEVSTGSTPVDVSTEAGQSGGGSGGGQSGGIGTDQTPIAETDQTPVAETDQTGGHGNVVTTGEASGNLVIPGELPGPGTPGASFSPGTPSFDEIFSPSAVDDTYVIFMLGLCLLVISLYLLANSLLLTSLSKWRLKSDGNDGPNLLGIDLIIAIIACFSLATLYVGRMYYYYEVEIEEEIARYVFFVNPWPIIPLTFLLSILFSGFAFGRYLFLSHLISVARKTDDSLAKSARSPFIEIVVSLITVVGSFASIIGLLLYINNNSG